MPAKNGTGGALFEKAVAGICTQPFFMGDSFFNASGRCRAMRYWLMKSEPDEVSFDDVLAAPAQTVAWFGVRNYQARNLMRDAMQVGDGILFYHSSCAVPGIAGIAQVASGPYPD